MKEKSEKADLHLNIKKTVTWYLAPSLHRWGKKWNQGEIASSWALKSLRDGECSQETRRRLLLGRKAMTT